MRHAVSTWYSHRPIRTIVIGLFAASLVGAIAYQGGIWIQWRVFSAQLATTETNTAVPDRVATMEFQFRGETISLSIPYSSATLRTAERFDFSPAFERRGRWRTLYLSQAVTSQATTRFMDSLTAALRAKRARMHLDDDAYIELMSCAVQGVPYGDVDAPLKTPIEVIVRRSGVCTEKSVLLASMLVHEGFGAGVWSLYGHNHVGTAVRSSGSGFRNSGYAFIETTKSAYVGQVPGTYAASGPVYASPQLVKVAPGKRYQADAQVAYILWLRSSAERAARGAPWSDRGQPAATFDRSTAERLVRWIDWNADDRERVFDRLTLAASGRDVLLGM